MSKKPTEESNSVSIPLTRM